MIGLCQKTPKVYVKDSQVAAPGDQDGEADEPKTDETAFGGRGVGG